MVINHLSVYGSYVQNIYFLVTKTYSCKVCWNESVIRNWRRFCATGRSERVWVNISKIEKMFAKIYIFTKNIYQDK